MSVCCICSEPVEDYMLGEDPDSDLCAQCSWLRAAPALDALARQRSAAAKEHERHVRDNEHALHVRRERDRFERAWAAWTTQLSAYPASLILQCAPTADAVWIAIVELFRWLIAHDFGFDSARYRLPKEGPIS